MKFKLKRKGSSEPVLEVEFDFEEDKIMFPTKIDPNEFGSAFSENVDKFQEKEKMSALIDSLHFIDNLHGVADSYMTRSTEINEMQENFVRFTEDIYTRIHILGNLLNLELDADYGCTEEFITIVFWPLLTKIMLDAKMDLAKDASVNTEDAIGNLLEAATRKVLFKNLVVSNEDVINRLVDEGRSVSKTDSDSEFFVFVESTIKDIVENKDTKENECL